MRIRSTSKFRDTRVPESRCPYCGYKVDAAMAADRAHPDAVPKPGDVTVCMSCASALVFTDQLTVREPLPGEIEPIPPALRRVQAAVRQLDRRKFWGR